MKVGENGMMSKCFEHFPPTLLDYIIYPYNIPLSCMHVYFLSILHCWGPLVEGFMHGRSVFRWPPCWWTLNRPGQALVPTATCDCDMHSFGSDSEHVKTRQGTSRINALHVKSQVHAGVPIYDESFSLISSVDTSWRRRSSRPLDRSLDQRHKQTSAVQRSEAVVD